jgi:Alginate lyase
MSGNPLNGAQRASNPAAGHVDPRRPRGDRRGRLIFIAELAVMALLVGLLPNLPPGPRSANAGGGPVLVSVDTLRTRPTSGAAWTGLKTIADQPVGTISIADQASDADIRILAKGLVFARLGTESYRQAVIAALKSAIGTEQGGRTLALGRNLPGLVIAADLVSLRTADPAFDTGQFRPWLRSLLTEVLDGRTLTSTNEDRPNNWGTHAGAARVAIAAYLGDTAVLARAAQVFHGFLGSRSDYAGFSWGDLSWQCDPSKPVGINPAGCTKSGVVIDGVIPDDMRRGGVFQWPPVVTNYPWENLQGALLQAELLHAAGYDTWNWEDRALLRAARFLYDRAGWPAVGDDGWQTWLLDARYGTSFRVASPVRYGKNFGFTDWIYGSSTGAAAPPPAPNPTPTPKPTQPGATPAPTPAPVAGTAVVSANAPTTNLALTTRLSLTTVPVRVAWSLVGDPAKLARYDVQRSVDGGAYQRVAIASATTKRLVSALPPGHRYRFRVRAVDRAGRVSAWAAGSDTALARRQQGAGRYGGSGWLTAGATVYLGGSARASRAARADVSFSFSGTSVAWIGPVGPTRGRASVYVDGRLVTTVNLYRSGFQARQVLFATHVAAGSHTLTIRVAGTAGHPWVAVDAFAVLTPR